MDEFPEAGEKFILKRGEKSTKAYILENTTQ